MKSASALLVLALAAALGLAGAAAAAECEGRPSPTKLIVQVQGVRAAKGEVAVTIYPDEPRRFLAPKGKLLRIRVPAQAPTTAICFWLPQPAYYAVAVYHDANGDRDLNRSLVGLPTEGFGFSNDAPTPTGLPSFQAVRFRVVPGDSQIRIRLRYLR